VPTLTWLDSFEHQSPSITTYTGLGIYDGIGNVPQITFVPGRRAGSFAMQLAQDGVTTTRVRKNIAAGNRVLVDSFYFKASARPATDSPIYIATATINGSIQVSAANGNLVYSAGSGVSATVTGDWCDGRWHRFDIKFVTSGSTYTFDLYVDGVSQTQHVSNATTAADITIVTLGSNGTGANLTFQLADHVRSVTSGDFPIGPHRCLALFPNADGAHNWASTNMGPAAGGVASSVTTLWQSVDEVPPSDTDYIQYANTTATNTEYAEITLADDPVNATVWAARAIAAIRSSGTAANSATTRVVDGSGTTALNLYVGDQSDTSLRFVAALVPSITTNTLLNALKFRVGFPTDSNPAPWWAALMIDYAVPESIAPPFESRGRRNSMRRTRV
jgi:hypothetical protein